MNFVEIGGIATCIIDLSWDGRLWSASSCAERAVTCRLSTMSKLLGNVMESVVFSLHNKKCRNARAWDHHW